MKNKTVSVNGKIYSVARLIPGVNKKIIGKLNQEFYLIGKTTGKLEIEKQLNKQDINYFNLSKNNKNRS